MKMAQRGLDIKLRKKFQGMEFRDFYELAAKVTKYEELLKEESYLRKKSMEPIVKSEPRGGSGISIYYRNIIGTFNCHLLVEKGT